MSKAAWPTAGDLQDFLAAAGLLEQPPSGSWADLDYANAAEAGRTEWERLTGFQPFMAAAEDTTRYYTPDGTNILDLKGGLVAITSLKAGISETSSGYELTENRDYWLMPLNARLEYRPATYIRFAGRQVGLPRSIGVTGRFGYCPNGEIPDDAWRAVLLLGVGSLAPAIQSLTSHGGMKRITEGDVSYEYGALITEWRTEAERLAKRFRRLRVI